MSTIYIIQQGDCLASIARENGFADYRRIYDAAENESFRKARPNPNLVFPGDVLMIPELGRKEEARSADSSHRFKVATQTTLLRIRLTDPDDEPLPHMAYRLDLGTRIITAETNDDGVLEQIIPSTLSSATLIVDDLETTWTLSVGHLDPIETVTGVQARLNNLGYDSGRIDGIDGPITKAAVRVFQEDNPPLAVDGICGPRTRAILRENHGC